ncbi:MAG: SirB2 family protein [Pseudomonadota bacterium]|nr:SirB2 family protein [Pseudomonadota bacterium]
MEWYPLLRSIHLLTVAITVTLFALRASWMLVTPRYLELRWVRVLPHVNDSILLASAVGLCLVLHQYPLVTPWLTAKLAALLVYIVLGSLALRRGRTRMIRVLALPGAAAALVYLLWVARAHDPTPWSLG